MATIVRPTPGTLIASVKSALPGMDTRRIELAIKRATAWYGDRRMELLPEMTQLEHAMRTAELLTEFCPDEDAIIACVLQHSLEGSEGTLSELGREFGRAVRDMVSRIHLLSHLYTTSWRRSTDDMRIMLVSVADDVRVLLISLSVACVFVQQLSGLKSDYRVRLCRQSLQLFAPIAARLGIYALKYRLERSAFPECYPTDAQHIELQLEKLRSEHGKFLEHSATAIRDSLRRQGISSVQVMAREKHPYSIFQKMSSKSVTALEKITDLFAIRVVVPTIQDCYQTLGLIHQMGTPISHRFKDYISFPKPNGYQSLHTCLLNLPHAPKNVMIEVQIRTEEMHREAEYGVAAHWSYKETGKKGSRVIDSVRQYQLSDVLLKQQSVGAADRKDQDDELTLVNHIYVLTPRGDIIELPEGGTPLDFAFMLHTDIGLKFRSARVNGSIVPITHELENGDIVEILTHKYPRPALQWLEALKTASARSKLKAYFFAHNRPQFLIKGRQSVNAELKTRGLPQLDNDLTLLDSFDGKKISMKEREDLLVKVGMGSVRTSSILRHVSPEKVVPRKKVVTKTRVVPISKNDIIFEDAELSMPHRFAKCCAPQSAETRPERIIGIVTRNGVVNVHDHKCHMAKSASSERKVKMRWAVGA
jgi:GTP pyrophosphokinase